MSGLERGVDRKVEEVASDIRGASTRGLSEVDSQDLSPNKRDSERETGDDSLTVTTSSTLAEPSSLSPTLLARRAQRALPLASEGLVSPVSSPRNGFSSLPSPNPRLSGETSATSAIRGPFNSTRINDDDEHSSSSSSSSSSKYEDAGPSAASAASALLSDHVSVCPATLSSAYRRTTSADTYTGADPSLTPGALDMYQPIQIVKSRSLDAALDELATFGLIEGLEPLDLSGELSSSSEIRSGAIEWGDASGGRRRGFNSVAVRRTSGSSGSSGNGAGTGGGEDGKRTRGEKKHKSKSDKISSNSIQIGSGSGKVDSEESLLVVRRTSTESLSLSFSATPALGYVTSSGESNRESSREVLSLPTPLKMLTTRAAAAAASGAAADGRADRSRPSVSSRAAADGRADVSRRRRSGVDKVDKHGKPGKSNRADKPEKINKTLTSVSRNSCVNEIDRKMVGTGGGGALGAVGKNVGVDSSYRAEDKDTREDERGDFSRDKHKRSVAQSLWPLLRQQVSACVPG